KKLLFILVLLLSINSLFAQNKDEEIPDGWTKKGNISFLFNQSTFSNWLAGGENNVSGNLGFNYDFNYKKNDWVWDNKLLASYGIVKTKNSAFEKKTDDRLEFNSLLGKKAVKN